jgi:hypothetical protein
MALRDCCPRAGLRNDPNTAPAFAVVRSSMSDCIDYTEAATVIRRRSDPPRTNSNKRRIVISRAQTALEAL